MTGQAMPVTLLGLELELRPGDLSSGQEIQLAECAREAGLRGLTAATPRELYILVGKRLYEAGVMNRSLAAVLCEPGEAWNPWRASEIENALDTIDEPDTAASPADVVTRTNLVHALLDNFLDMSKASPSKPPLYVSLASTFIDQAWTARFLDQLGPTRGQVSEVHLLLSGGGGDADAAAALFNVLLGWPDRVITHAVGPIASAMLTVFLAGSERLAAPATQIVHHGTLWGPQAQRYDLAELEEACAKLRARDGVRAQQLIDRCTFTDPAEVWALLRRPVHHPLEWCKTKGIIHGIGNAAIPAGASWLVVEPSPVPAGVIRTASAA